MRGDAAWRREVAWGVAGAVVLALVALRRVLFAPGLVLYGDMAFSLRPEAYAHAASTWDEGAGAPGVAQAWAPVYALIRVLGVEPVEKAMLFLTVVLTALGVFLAVRALLPGRAPRTRVLAGWLGAALAVGSPYFYARFLGQLSILWGYALLPFAVLAYAKAARSEGPRAWAWSALAGGVLAAAALHVHVAIAGAIALGAYVLGRLAWPEGRRRGRVVGTAGVTVAVFVLASLHWMLPAVVAFPSDHPVFPASAGITTYLSANAGPMNAVRAYGSAIPTALDAFLDRPGAVFALSFAPLLLALAALALRWDHVPVRVAAGVLLAALLLGMGTAGPLGDAYLWLILDSPLALAGWLLRDPPRLLGAVAMVVAILAPVGLVAVLDLARHAPRLPAPAPRVAALGMAALVLAPVGVAMGSAFAGADEPPLVPATPPDAYRQVGERMEGRDTLWLPLDRGQFRYGWNQGLGVSQAARTLSGTTGFLPQHTDPELTKLTYHETWRLARGGVTNLGERLAPWGVDGVAFHADHLPYVPEAGDDAAALDAALRAQSDLQLWEGSTGEVRLYENPLAAGAREPTRRLALAGGWSGLDALTLVPGFRAADWDVAMTEMRWRGQGTAPADAWVLADRDLVDCVAASGHVVPPSAFALARNPYEGWTPEPLLGGPRSMALLAEEFRLDPASATLVSMGAGPALTLVPATAAAPFDAPADAVEVWVRVPLGGRAQDLVVLVDGARVGGVRAGGGDASGYAWVRAGEARNLTAEGPHEVAVAAEAGPAVFDGVALLPPGGARDDACPAERPLFLATPGERVARNGTFLDWTFTAGSRLAPTDAFLLRADGTLEGVPMATLDAGAYRVTVHDAPDVVALLACACDPAALLAAPPAAEVEVTTRTPSRRELVLPPGGRVVLDVPYHPGWRLETENGTLAPRASLGTLLAFDAVPGGGRATLVFAGDEAFAIGKSISGVTFAAVVGLAAWRGARWRWKR